MKTDFGIQLSRNEMKNVMGGFSEPPNTCDAYCGNGAGVTCAGKCSSCEDAGNGYNPDVKGGDKICF